MNRPPTNLPILGSQSAEEEATTGGCGGGSCGGGGGGFNVVDLEAEPSARLPKWLKRNIPKGNNVGHTTELLSELKLETVCDNARCPLSLIHI